MQNRYLVSIINSVTLHNRVNKSDGLLLSCSYLEFALQLGAVAVEQREVEGAEVGVEVLVDELVVDAEVVRVRRRLRPHRRLRRGGGNQLTGLSRGREGFACMWHKFLHVIDVSLKIFCISVICILL